MYCRTRRHRHEIQAATGSRSQRPHGAGAVDEVLHCNGIVVGVESERLDPARARVGVEIDVAQRRREVAAQIPGAADRMTATEQRSGDRDAIGRVLAQRQRDRAAVGVEGRPAREPAVQPVDCRARMQEQIHACRQLRGRPARIRPADRAMRVLLDQVTERQLRLAAGARVERVARVSVVDAGRVEGADAVAVHALEQRPAEVQARAARDVERFPCISPGIADIERARITEPRGRAARVRAHREAFGVAKAQHPHARARGARRVAVEERIAVQAVAGRRIQAQHLA